MRKNKFDRLLAGTMLALIVAAPTLVVRRARPGRIGRAAAALAQRPGAAPPRSRAGAAAAAARAAEASRAPQPSRRIPTARAAGAKQQFQHQGHARQSARRQRHADQPTSCARSSPASRSRSASTARPSARRSRRSMPRATTRRCGSATASSPRAPSRRSRGSRTPAPTGSTRPIIRCRNSAASPAPRRWPTATSSSPIRCSLSPAIWRSAASRRRACSAEVDYGNHTPEPADILRKIADARDADAALDSFNPPHDGFRALKEKLAELRGSPRAPGRQSHCRRRGDQAGRQGRARAGVARTPRRRRQAGRPHLRQGAVQRHQAGAGPRRHQADRPDRWQDARRHQRPEAGPADRARARQHGALALAAARSRQDLCDGQYPGLHAQGGARSTVWSGAPRSSPASRRRRRRC